MIFIQFHKMPYQVENMKIKKYVKPEVIDLSHRSAKGNCVNGSIDSDTCGIGGQAVSNCTQMGSTAGGWCTSTGTVPTVGCFTGSTK
jgi:hypothetical protein